MNIITLRCCICQAHILTATGEVSGSPTVRALCDNCLKDKGLVVIYSEEAQEIETKFKEIVYGSGNNQ